MFVRSNPARRFALAAATSVAVAGLVLASGGSAVAAAVPAGDPDPVSAKVAKLQECAAKSTLQAPSARPAGDPAAAVGCLTS